MRSVSVEPLLLRAGGFEQRVELAFLDVRGSLEHEVLEEVREPGAARLLARRADVIPDVHRRERHGVVLVQDHVQPVRQRELGEGHGQRGARVERSAVARRPARRRRRCRRGDIDSRETAISRRA